MIVLDAKMARVASVERGNILCVGAEVGKKRPTFRSGTKSCISFRKNADKNNIFSNGLLPDAT